MSSPTGDLTPTINRFGLDDFVLNEADRPWIQSEKLPFMRWQPVRFDIARGAWTFVVHITTSGVVGRHQHHGEVFAYVLEGSWRYAEYDWVAHTGAFVHEAPGAIHTLMIDDPAGMKTLFVVNGAMDFFDENDNRVDQETVFYFVDRYVAHCEANGLEVDQRLFY